MSKKEQYVIGFILENLSGLPGRQNDYHTKFL